MLYINKSNTTNTFYGVTFKPNDVKNVPGYINHPEFERVHSSPVEPPKGTSTKTKTINKQEEKK